MLLGQPARLQTLEVGQREPQPGGDEAALAAVRLVAAVVRDLGQKLGVARPAKRGRPSPGSTNGSRVAELPAQLVDAIEVVAQQRLLLQPDGLGGDACA